MNHVVAASNYVFGEDGDRIDRLSYILYTAFRLGESATKTVEYAVNSMGYTPQEGLIATQKIATESVYYAGRWVLYFPETVGYNAAN